MVVACGGLAKSQATLVAVSAPVREPAPQAVRPSSETESNPTASSRDGRGTRMGPLLMGAERTDERAEHKQGIRIQLQAGDNRATPVRGSVGGRQVEAELST